MRVEPVLQFGGCADATSGIVLELAAALERFEVEVDFGEGVSAGFDEAEDVDGRLVRRGDDDAGVCRDMSKQLACLHHNRRTFWHRLNSTSVMSAGLATLPSRHNSNINKI